MLQTSLVYQERVGLLVYIQYVVVETTIFLHGDYSLFHDVVKSFFWRQRQMTYAFHDED